MELYQLRQFAAVAKYENMTRAAESLNVAQPAVSKTIRNLESELGAELFERTGKGLRRTEQGDILLRYARTILEAERDARGEIEESLHRTGGLCICALSCAERISEIPSAAAQDFDPAQWNVSDTSPEAEATRRMYAAGLTLSALNGQPLDDELPPPLDSSAEAVARRKLYAAGLSKSAQDGEAQALPYADWSAEKQSAYRLAEAGLTAGPSDSGAVSADLTEVDALSGATITSAAVTTVVNDSYFYVTEVLRAE